MQVWKVVIRPDPEEADRAQGYALAETCEDALALVNHPGALAFPKHPDTPWPGAAYKRLVWVSGFGAMPRAAVT